MKSIKNLADKTLLLILDGYGINPNDHKNAIKDANTPTLDKLFNEYPYTTIESSGLSVGLPEGVDGNSEVGHMNMGAGRVIKQDLVRINEVVDNHTLGEMNLIHELVDKTKVTNNRVHLMGLLSDGGVHSHINHIKETIKILSKSGVEVYFHAFMDGRDTPRDHGHKYIDELKKVSGFTFASMQGRFVGMDRDKRFERIQHAYEMMIGKRELTDLSPEEYIQEEYKKEIFDEFITPVLFNKDYAIKNDDTIFFLNFRPDRAIELTQTFNLKEFEHFERAVMPSYFLCMTPYIADQMKLPVLFDKEVLTGGISEYISKIGLKQFKTSETEKFAHVTYFFNGGKKDSFQNEDRVLVDSPKEVKTYDEKPEMSAFEVTEKLIEAVDSEAYSYLTVNYANSDMVGHTGNYDAAIKALEALDSCVDKVVQKCQEKNVTVIITSDHGNSDQMVHENGTPHTAHTGAIVPFCVIHKSLKGEKAEINGSNFALKDIAPSVLYTMGIEIPNNFEGKNIFK